MEDLLKVGVITTTHGVRGEVKVFPTTDPERFLDLEYVLLDAGREMKKLEIRNVKFFKNLVILKFNGIDNINDIEMYKGRDLWVPREEAQELDEDEYYIGDLIGMEVFTEEGHFGIYNMLPKFRASVDFVEECEGRSAYITSFDKVTDALKGKTGTVIR